MVTVETPIVASDAERLVSVVTPRTVALSETLSSPVTVTPVPIVSNFLELS